MFRKITLILLVACSVLADGRTRSVSSGTSDAALSPISAPFATVSGTVTGVSGNLISIADGLVTIDASAAKITDDHGNAGSIATVTVGSTVYVMLATSNPTSNAPLPATMITVARAAHVTLSGPVQSVGTNTFTVLGRTITVDANTSFGGFHVTKVSDIMVNDIVQVKANAVGGVLLASSVLVFPPVPKAPTVIHGTVKSIGTDAWVITDGAAKDWSVVINAQTKIIGDPKIGDTVDILANLDNAHQYIALSIMKSIVITPIASFSGEVKAIGPTSWIIRDSHLNKEITVLVNQQTKITGDPHVNDGVIVTATVDGAGNYTAITIIKLGIVPPTVTIRGTVKMIAIPMCPACPTTKCSCPPEMWTISPPAGLGPDVTINVDRHMTKISGDPKVGDTVEVVAQVGPTGLNALSIVKQ